MLFGLVDPGHSVILQNFLKLPESRLNIKQSQKGLGVSNQSISNRFFVGFLSHM